MADFIKNRAEERLFKTRFGGVGRLSVFWYDYFNVHLLNCKANSLLTLLIAPAQQVNTGGYTGE